MIGVTGVVVSVAVDALLLELLFSLKPPAAAICIGFGDSASVSVVVSSFSANVTGRRAINGKCAAAGPSVVSASIAVVGFVVEPAATTGICK